MHSLFAIVLESTSHEDTIKRGKRGLKKKKHCISCMGKKSENKQTSLSSKGVLGNGKRLTDLV